MSLENQFRFFADMSFKGNRKDCRSVIRFSALNHHEQWIATTLEHLIVASLKCLPAGLEFEGDVRIRLARSLRVHSRGCQQN